MTDTRPTFPAPGLPGAAAMSNAAHDNELDDDLEGLTTATPSTALGDLTAELAAELDSETFLEVPARPGYVLACGLDIDHHLLGQWQKRATDKTQPGQFDELKFSLTVIAAKCRRIIRNGAPVILDGIEADFRTPAFQQAVGAHRAIDAVRRTFGRDAHAVAACKKLLTDAGYSDEVMAADPTETSSTD